MTKLMENQPQQIDVRFALLAAQTGTWQIGIDSKRFNCDEQCSTIFGTDRMSLSYNDLLLLIKSDDRKQVDNALRAAFAPGSSGDFEAHFRTVNGGNNSAQMIGCCEFSEDGKPSRFAGIVQRIKQTHDARELTSSYELHQKIKEDVLRDSEEKYHTLFNSIDQGCYITEVIFDANENPVDIFYQDANPAAYRMTGRDFKGKFLREINPAYESYWYEIFGRVAKTGRGERMQRYAVPDQKWFDFYVFRIGQADNRVAVIFQDITERERRELNQAFLAKITNDLSRLSAASEIMETVGKRIGKYLEVESCLFIDVTDTPDQINVFDPLASDAPGEPLHKVRPIGEFMKEKLLREYHGGDVVVVRNTNVDSFSEGKDYNEVGVGAFVSVPFHRNGAWTNSLILTDANSRNWREDEIELLGELAYRIFPRLGRASAEEALRRSEENFRSLFQSIREGFMVADIIRDDNGVAIDYRFQMLNPAYEKLAGISGASIGHTAREIYPDSNNWGVDIYASVVNSSQPLQFEDFSESLGKWFSVLAYPAGDDRFGVLYNDITDQKRQEANLAFLADIAEDLSNRSTAEEIMETVGKKTGAFLRVKSCLFVDVYDQQGEVTVFDAWNSEDVPSLRYQTIRLSDFISEEFSKANREDGGAVVRDTSTDPRAVGNDYSDLGIAAFVTIPFHRKGIWTNYLAITDSQPRDWREDEIGVFRELSNRVFPRLERARAEESLRRLEQRTRIAIEAADMATWEWNLITNQVYWNEQHFQLLGIEPTINMEQLIDEPRNPEDFIRHVHPDDLERIREDLSRTIREMRVYASDFRIVRTDGTVRWMSGYGRITADEDGRATRFSGVMFDIDARKQAEYALIKADKNKDEFLATLAHELRNPLAPLRNTLHLLDLKAGNNQTVISAVAIMNRQVDQLVRLIDDLLDVSRISRGKIQLRLEQIDFNDVIQQAIETTGPLYDSGQRRLMVHLTGTPLPLQGDMTRLIHVVSNLLNNAAKFTSDGGAVQMVVEHKESEIILTISDDGIGIDETELERIFELFAQSDTTLERSRGGLGLGLTLVRQLVELHGGQVTASSRGHNLGSTFTVHLPTPIETFIKQ
jgi:PAS domain S-box-containing protein